MPYKKLESLPPSGSPTGCVYHLLESHLRTWYLSSPTYPTHIPKQRSCHMPPLCNRLSQSRNQHWPTVPVRSSDCSHITSRDPTLGVYPPWSRTHYACGPHMPSVSSYLEPFLGTWSYVLDSFKACRPDVSLDDLQHGPTSSVFPCDWTRAVQPWQGCDGNEGQGLCTSWCVLAGISVGRSSGHCWR